MRAQGWRRNRELVRFLDEIARLTERAVADVLAEERARLLALPDPFRRWRPRGP